MALDPNMLAQLMAGAGPSTTPQQGGLGGLAQMLGGGSGLSGALMQQATPHTIGQAPPFPGMLGGGPRPMQPMQPPMVNPFPSPVASAMPGASGAGGAAAMPGVAAPGGQTLDPLVIALLRARLAQSMSGAGGMGGGGMGGGLGF